MGSYANNNYKIKDKLFDNQLQNISEYKEEKFSAKLIIILFFNSEQKSWVPFFISWIPIVTEATCTIIQSQEMAMLEMILMHLTWLHNR